MDKETTWATGDPNGHNYPQAACICYLYKKAARGPMIEWHLFAAHSTHATFAHSRAILNSARFDPHAMPKA